MKKIMFMLIFIFTICFFNSVRAIVADTDTVLGYCEYCGAYKQGKIKSVEGGNFHGLYCECGGLMSLDGFQGTTMEPHKYDNNGVCTKCGYKVNDCNHEGTVWMYTPNDDGTTHEIRCRNCNGIVNKREPCSPNQENCEKCSVKKPANFDIPTRVYYIDETGLKAVGSKESNTSISISLENIKGAPYFSWTMSTAGAKNFNSNENNTYSSAASDGTIRFWYTGNGFDAKLEPTPKNLSGEVLIRVTLSVDDVEISQNIRIIKNGSPQSSCTIYLKNDKVALNDEKLTLMIRTNYGDFSDEEVRKIRKESTDELPFYTVKDKKIEITSSDDTKLKIKDYEIKEITDNTVNGYMAKIKIAPKEVGQVKIKYRLTTEYSYMNHETIEKEREGILLVNILEKMSEKEKDPPGGKGGDPGEDEHESPKSPEDGGTGSRRGASGGLAFVGVMGLLIVAIIGSKMLNHR